MVPTRDGNVDADATEKRRTDMRGKRRASATVAKLLNAKVKPDEGTLIDNNLVAIYSKGESRVACRHCGTRRARR